MAVPNVNEITTTLRMLSDEQLRKYAQMHKGDPYILPMAISESNARKQIRAAGQATQGAQPQPKVADQAIAQMSPQQLPENVGIGALPAPNMQFAAEGGIMGYEGYDEGPSDFGQESVIRMAGGGVAGYSGGGPTKAGPEFMRFLKSIGFDLVDFSAMDSDAKAQLVDRFEQSKTATPAATSSAAPAAQQAAQTPTGAEARKTYAPSKAAGTKATALLGKAVTTGKKFTPAGLGIEALTAMGDYKFQDPDGIDTSLAGTVRDLSQGEFGRAGTGLVRGLGEAAADVGSFGANMLDYVVPGEAPVSSAYEKFLANNTSLQGPRARALANVPAAPSGATMRSQLNRADAATYAQPGVDNAPAAGATAAASPSAAPSSVLSPSTLASTGGGRGGPATGAATTSAGLRDEQGVASLYSDLLKTQKYEDPAKGEVDKLAQEQLAAATKRKEEYDAFVAKQGDVYKDRSDRLAEREKGIGKQVDQNVGLALLNAGLAVMSTPGGLATAIGKGAQVGTAQYVAGLDKINLARDRLADAKDKMDELRMNRDEMTFKQRSALEADIDKAKLDARKMSIDGLRTAAGITEQRAGKILDKTLDMEKVRFEQGEMTKRTLATIRASGDNRKEQLWKGLMQKHNNDPVAAAKEYNAIEAGDKTNVAAEKLVQDRVGEWEKANKLRLSVMKPAEQAAELRAAEQRLRNDIYTQLKLTPTMGAGASSGSGFKFRGVEPAQ